MSELNIVERVIALEAVELLRNLNPDQLARIATIAKEQSYPAGTLILTPSKPADAVFIVLDGAVDLKSSEGGASTRAGANDVLGAWALFDSEPLQVTATTIEPSRVLRIGRDDFYDLLSDNMEITASIFATLVKRFRVLIDGGGART